MATTYHPGDTSTIYLQVLRLSGSAPVFPDDYTAPQVRVLHVEGGSPVTDVALAPMTQLDDNLWYHQHQIPASPFVGDYLVEFSTTIDGIQTEATDGFRVEPVDIVEEGSGSCEISGTVRDEGTQQPIAGVTVLVFGSGDLVNAIAKAVTDSDGRWTVFLNPDSYKIRFHRVGFIDETHDLTVNPDCTHLISGN